MVLAACTGGLFPGFDVIDCGDLGARLFVPANLRAATLALFHIFAVHRIRQLVELVARWPLDFAVLLLLVPRCLHGATIIVTAFGEKIGVVVTIDST